MYLRGTGEGSSQGGRAARKVAGSCGNFPVPQAGGEGSSAAGHSPRLLGGMESARHCPLPRSPGAPPGKGPWPILSFLSGLLGQGMQRCSEIYTARSHCSPGCREVDRGTCQPAVAGHGRGSVPSSIRLGYTSGPLQLAHTGTCPNAAARTVGPAHARTWTAG